VLESCVCSFYMKVLYLLALMHRTTYRPIRRDSAHDMRYLMLLILWAVLICCVIVGSLLPSASPIMVAVGRLHINDKVEHFSAYLALALLPVLGFRHRRKGIMVGLSMFILGILMEAGQHFSPGRVVEFGDVIANGLGVSCGALLGLPIRARISLL
jgi:VanZ family protein